MVSRRLLPRAIARRLDLLDQLEQLPKLQQLTGIAEALGRIESRQLDSRRGPLAEHEFRVYSHAGEDGIIDYLSRSVSPSSRTFVEFGVEDYRESNTRFLLVHRGWSGLVLDGSSANVEAIRRDPLYWNNDLRAVDAFVTRENVNELLSGNGMRGELGLLSVDVDGNDYWIFDAIDVVSPVIAVVEYNHRFGAERAVTIPYDPRFVRRRTDPSWLFGGASLRAVAQSASRKGMALVGCNSFGNNAFFVRDDLLPDGLPAMRVEDAFVVGKFRESMILHGREFVPGPDDERALLADAELVTVE